MSCCCSSFEVQGQSAALTRATLSPRLRLTALARVEAKVALQQADFSTAVVSTGTALQKVRSDGEAPTHFSLTT